jgi:hypothetical protein
MATGGCVMLGGREQFHADAKFSTTLPEIPLEYAGLRAGGVVGGVVVSKSVSVTIALER